MDKKYTIFVSSTQSDLATEREAVAKAILELGHIPVGMEMFSAADEQQWQLIQRQIDQTDYYIVIVAHRYGSMAGDVSYTEREYDYAISADVPVLGFIIEDDAGWPVDRIEKEHAKGEALAKFKEKIKTRMVSFWNNADHLNGKVLAALSKQFALTPRPGWIRASKVPGFEVVSELSRLSKENAELRNRASAMEPEPQFEIVAAELLPVTATALRPNLSVLIYYHGSPLYVPGHRWQMELQVGEVAQQLKTQIFGASSLIEREGDDLQINGSGLVSFVSVDTVSPTQLSGEVKLRLKIQYRPKSLTQLAVNLKGPDWKFGEAGLNR